MPDKTRFGLKAGTIKNCRDLLVRAGLNPFYLALLVVMSFILAFLEGVSTVLLLPLAKGALSLDFGFVKEVPVIKRLFSMLPAQFTASNTAIFIMIATLLFIIVMMKNALKYGSALIAAGQSKKVLFNIKREIFRRYMLFGKLFYDRTHLSYLMSVIQSDSAFPVQIITGLVSFLEGLLTLAVYLIILLKISWVMTLCALTLIPVIDISLRWLIKKIRAASVYQIEARNFFQRHIYNVLTCMPLVKSYRSEEAEIGEFARRADKVAKLDYGMAKKQALIAPIQEIITMAAILVIAVAMFISVSVGRGNAAGLLVFFYVLRKAMANFGIFTHIKTSFAQMGGPISTVEDILSDENKYFITGGDRTFPGLAGSIEIKDLAFSYIPGHPVLQGITFSMEKGKATAIVGATGSGKTTLISLIMRFYDCPPGTIFIDGTDIREYSLKTLMQHVALVSQDTLLFADTIKNNIAYGVEKKKADACLIDAAKKAQLYDFIARLPDGLNTPIGERGVRLSGGERQRLAIARALMKGSEILILDEATSSLDSVTEHLIQEAIDEAIKGRTAIVIAHRLSTIKKADKIVVLEHGKLVEEGSLQELLDKKGKFFTYWEAQKFY